MSLDLEIKINKAILVDRLLKTTENVIKDLLGLKHIPQFKAEQMIMGRRQPLVSDSFSTSNGVLLIGWEEFQAFATVTVVDLPDLPPFSNGMTTGLHATVSATRSPIGYALAACVAVALARDEKSSIVDDAYFWTPVREQSAHDFARLVALEGTYQSIPIATEALYAKMKDRPRESDP